MTTLPGWLAWLLLALPCGSAPACKCVSPGVEEMFARSEMVFTGIVLQAGSLGPPAADPRYPASLAAEGVGALVQPVTFRLTRAWKGGGADTVTVGHPYLSCGPGFTPGTEYMVYAVHSEYGGLATAGCWRTRELSRLPWDGIDDVPILDSIAPRAAR
jgi:hypothetical protein